MSVNQYKPHVCVIPEDDANRQLANGFVQHYEIDVRAVEIATPAGGWGRVLDVFETQYVPYLRRRSVAHVVMVIDFDGVEARRAECELRIPDDIKSRVFLIGARDNPEVLKAEMKASFETIGHLLASNCVNEQGVWNHEHLAHNAAEIQRMADAMKSIVFPGISHTHPR